MHSFVSEPTPLRYSVLLLSVLSLNAQAEWLFSPQVLIQVAVVQPTIEPDALSALEPPTLPGTNTRDLPSTTWQLNPWVGPASSLRPRPEASTPGLRF